MYLRASIRPDAFHFLTLARLHTVDVRSSALEQRRQPDWNACVAASVATRDTHTLSETRTLDPRRATPYPKHALPETLTPYPTHSLPETRLIPRHAHLIQGCGLQVAMGRCRFEARGEERVARLLWLVHFAVTVGDAPVEERREAEVELLSLAVRSGGAGAGAGAGGGAGEGEASRGAEEVKEALARRLDLGGRELLCRLKSVR
eukprot:2235270-Rhodomonas_salina.1